MTQHPALPAVQDRADAYQLIAQHAKTLWDAIYAEERFRTVSRRDPLLADVQDACELLVNRAKAWSATCEAVAYRADRVPA